MPIPKPNKGEKKDDFISRCMGNSVMTKEYGDEKQRYAVCNSAWENRNKKSENKNLNYDKEFFNELTE